MPAPAAVLDTRRGRRTVTPVTPLLTPEVTMQDQQQRLGVAAGHVRAAIANLAQAWGQLKMCGLSDYDYQVERAMAHLSDLGIRLDTHTEADSVPTPGDAE